MLCVSGGEMVLPVRHTMQRTNSASTAAVVQRIQERRYNERRRGYNQGRTAEMLRMEHADGLGEPGRGSGVRTSPA